MALDTWSHLLDPGQVFKQFSELFISFSEKWAPELELSSEMLDANYGRQMKTFAQSLELLDEPVLHNIQIIECVKPLGELIGRLKGTARSSLKLVTTDVLVCAALVPSLIIPAPRHYYSLFKYTSAISRFSLRPISPALCKALLQELLSVVSINDHSEYVISTKSTSLLCHIDLESYSRETLEKRLFWLSLAHLSSPMRSDLLESSRDSLLWRILESPHAHLWALATSNCDEQYFLNTCDTAARLSSIVSYHYCIASLIHLGRVLSQCVEQRLKLASKTLPAYPAFWGSSPSQYDHSNAILTSVREVLNQLEQDIRTLLDSEKISAQEGEEARDFTRRDITNDKEVVLEMVLVRHEFVRRWQREMQKLSSIFFPENPVVLTEKTFKNDWHKSAKWMTARAFIEQLIVPGVPTFLSRSEASRTLEQISCDYLHTHHHLVDPEDDKSMWLDFPWSVAEENNEETKTSILERLWNRVAFLDGALISSREQLFFGYWEIGHLSYWKAVWMGQKYFLISDPELQYFKVLSIDQAVKFVSDIKSRVNPLDGSVQQHYRARRLCREEST